MGHVLSFPVLCLANYLTFRWTFHKIGRKAPRVLINGDDILFKCTRKEYNEWCHWTRSIGLIPSLGKNLMSQSVCQINSVLFRIRMDSRPCLRQTVFESLDYQFIPFYSGERVINDYGFYTLVDEVPYINYGIVCGRGKGRECEADDFSFESDRTWKNLLTYRTPLDEMEKKLCDLRSLLVNRESDLEALRNGAPGIDYDYLKKKYYYYRPHFQDLWNMKKTTPPTNMVEFIEKNMSREFVDSITKKDQDRIDPSTSWNRFKTTRKESYIPVNWERSLKKWTIRVADPAYPIPQNSILSVNTEEKHIGQPRWKIFNRC